MTVLGVVAGLNFEAALVVRSARESGVADRIRVRAGMGRIEARRAAEMLVKDGASALLSFGIAGGLAPTALCGAAFVADDVVGDNLPALPCAMGWRERLRTGLGVDLHGTLAHADGIIGRGGDKTNLFLRTGALAADMESYGIAEAARDAGLPFAALRVVADTVGEDLPEAALHAMAPDGSLKLRATLGRILRDPFQIPDLIRLGRSTARARNRLRTLATTGARDLFFAKD